MPRIGMAKINAFDVNTHGFFFWNFRTELEPKWSYQEAVARGWLPTAEERNSEEYVDKLSQICKKKTSFSLWHVLIFVVFLFLSWLG